jgi:hypothetical protein
MTSLHDGKRAPGAEPSAENAGAVHLGAKRADGDGVFAPRLSFTSDAEGEDCGKEHRAANVSAVSNHGQLRVEALGKHERPPAKTMRLVLPPDDLSPDRTIGRWTSAEHERFLFALQRWGNNCAQSPPSAHG